MFYDIVLHKPDFIIRCNGLTHSNQIYGEMRGNAIVRSYVYGILVNDKQNLLTYKWLKVGRSSPNPTEREVQIGERISRQLHHVPGWQYFKNDPISSNGQDFMNGVERMICQKRLHPSFNKDDITIAVWNISKRMHLTDMLETPESEFQATGWAEGELAQQHKNLYGELPLLNFVDPSLSSFYKKGYIPKSVGSIFGWS